MKFMFNACFYLFRTLRPFKFYRATANDVAGHRWPTGREFDTCAVDDHHHPQILYFIRGWKTMQFELLM